MDDLLSKLDEMWEHYEFAYKAHNEAKTNDGREFWFRSMGYGAMDICNFLIEHDATVTFTPEPSDAPVAAVEAQRDGLRFGLGDEAIVIDNGDDDPINGHIVVITDDCPVAYDYEVEDAEGNTALVYDNELTPIERSDATSAGSE